MHHATIAPSNRNEPLMVRRRAVLLLSLCSTLAACPRSRNQAGVGGTDTTVSSRQPSQGSRVPEAEQRLAAYLEASLEVGSILPKSVDSLVTCVPEGMVEPLFTLAKYRVLSSAARRDTIDASAAVVTVAKEETDPHVDGRYVTAIRVHEDTLHWSLVRDSSSRWIVCGISREGYDFGHYGEDRNTTWLPKNGSWEIVRTLADSVHRH
jgi:hypothetical protein